MKRAQSEKRFKSKRKKKCWYIKKHTDHINTKYYSAEEDRNAMGVQIVSAVSSSLATEQGGTKQ